MQAETQLWKKNSRLMVIGGTWGPIIIRLSMVASQFISRHIEMPSVHAIHLYFTYTSLFFRVCGILFNILLIIGLARFNKMFSGKEARYLKIILVTLLAGFVCDQILLLPIGSVEKLILAINNIISVVILVSFFLLSRSPSIPPAMKKGAVCLYVSFGLILLNEGIKLYVGPIDMASFSQMPVFHQIIAVIGTFTVIASSLLYYVGWFMMGKGPGLKTA